MVPAPERRDYEYLQEQLQRFETMMKQAEASVRRSILRWTDIELALLAEVAGHVTTLYSMALERVGTGENLDESAWTAERLVIEMQKALVHHAQEELEHALDVIHDLDGSPDEITRYVRVRDELIGALVDQISADGGSES